MPRRAEPAVALDIVSALASDPPSWPRPDTGRETPDDDLERALNKVDALVRRLAGTDGALPVPEGPRDDVPGG